MDKFNLISQIESEYSFRRKELSDLIGITELQNEERYISIMSNYFIVLLYSNIQGFIENSFISIDNYICKNFKFSELKKNLKIYILNNSKDLKLTHLIIFNPDYNLDYKEIFDRNSYGNINLLDNKTTNGLNYLMLEDFLSILSIDSEKIYEKIELKYLDYIFLLNKDIGSKSIILSLNKEKKKFFEFIFDKKLREFRNLISHGKSSVVIENINLGNKDILLKILDSQIKDEKYRSIHLVKLLNNYIYDKLIFNYKEILIDYINNDLFLE